MMKMRIMLIPPRPHGNKGQAIIEYLVVLAFSVMLLIRPFPANEINPNAPVGQMQGSVVDMLAKAIKDYHQHYSFAMSIAYIPNCTYPFTLSQSSIPSGILPPWVPNTSSALSLSGTIDRCIDATNPSIPIPDITGINLNFGDIKTLIEQAVLDAVKGAVDSFLPDNLLGNLFDPASIIGNLF
jgi:hypothetical protein